MKLRTKILGGFLIMVVLAVTLSVIGLVSTMKLDGLTTEMRELQQEQQSVSDVLNAHYVWRQGLTESVLSGQEFTGSINPDTCALGKWFASEDAQKITDAELLQLMDDVVKPHSFMHVESGNIIQLVQEGNIERAEDYLNSVIFPKTDEVISYLTKMQQRYAALVEAKDHESIRFANKMEAIDVALIFVALILGLFLAINISGSISKPITLITDYMKKAGATGDLVLTPVESDQINRLKQGKDEIAELSNGVASFAQHMILVSQKLELVARGDLSVDIKLLSDKDMMGKSLEQMLDNLNHMFEEIQASTSQVSTGSKQVADGAQSLAHGSTEQAASIEELAGSIAEIAQRTKDNSETAEKTSKLSTLIMENAEKGSSQMDEMIKAVKDINDAGLSINNIIKTIDDIAFQTNILALNAAVEAARAGNHGKGFAVVADEVRSLASKSAEAAKDTGDMIQNSIEKAKLGSHIAGETAASLKEIVTGITESSRLISEIANASEVQSISITQINAGIDQVAQVVQQNSATAEESAAVSEEMSGQSDILQQLIEQFKLKK